MVRSPPGPATGFVAGRGPLGVPGIGLFAGGTLGGSVGGRSACAIGRGTDGNGPPPPIGPGGGMPGNGPGGGICGGGIICAGTFGCEAFWSALPQLRQNFMPGGFSPRQTLQVFDVGNPCGGRGVCPNAGANELPQFRQNDDPGGLSWPHIEQRIGPDPKR